MTPNSRPRRRLLHLIGLSAAIILFAAWLAGTARADDKAAKLDLKKLQGTWVVVEAERDGVALDRIKGNKLIVKDHTFTIVAGTAELKGDLTLAPKKSPAHIDFQHQEGMLRDKKWEGIYKLKGDKLTLCYSEADSEKDRPDKFETMDGQNRLLIVVERQKR